MPDPSRPPDPAAGAPLADIPEPQPLSFEDAIDLVFERLLGWAESLVALLPNLVVALVVLLAFFLASRAVGRATSTAVVRLAHEEQAAPLLAGIARFLVLALGVFVALGVLQLDRALTSLLAGVGIVGLALGFAFQDIAANVMSGSIMALRRPFHVGDLVESHGHLGHVERTALRATEIRNFSGQLVLIPNKDVLQNPIRNYTRTGERRVEIDVGVAYDTDLEQARQVAGEAVAEVPHQHPERPPEVHLVGFGDSAIDLSVRFWLDLDDEKADFLEARSQGILRVKRAFDAAGIAIPFPIRTIDLPVPRDPAEASDAEAA